MFLTSAQRRFLLIPLSTGVFYLCNLGPHHSHYIGLFSLPFNSPLWLGSRGDKSQGAVGADTLNAL